ncbi:MAG: cytochrome c, partial [Planctomycetaceae bacterium]
VLLAMTMNVDHTQPNYEFLPEMNRSPASSAYAANAVFANRRTLQPPVPGTIARGELPLDYTATRDDALRAGEELQNPFRGEPTTVAGGDLPAPDPARQRSASLQRGAEVYQVMCVSCHGPTGLGDGPAAQRGFPPPPPLTTGKSAQMKDGQLFHILTYGQGSMAPMAAQLSRERRWDVIHYVRSLQPGAAASGVPGAETATESTANEEGRR